MPEPEGAPAAPEAPTATPEPINVMEQLAAQEDPTPKTPTTPDEHAPGVPSPESVPINIAANREALDRLTPEARSIVENELNRVNAVLTQKTQGLSAKQKELDTQMSAPAADSIRRMLQNTSSPREVSQVIQSIANEPAFREGLQTYLSQVGALTQSTPVGQPSQEVLDEMTPEERQAVQRAQTQDAQVSGLRSEVTTIRKQLEHERLNKQYGKIYNRDKADRLFSDVEKGSRLFTLEDAYIIATHKDNIQRAYDFGITNRKLDLTEKERASTPASSTHSGAESGEEDLKQQPNEDIRAFMRRIYDRAKNRVMKHGEARSVSGMQNAIPTGAGPGPPPI